MSHDDFAFEPVPGLPEALPEGERILWQGRPDATALARASLSLTWVAGYFALLAVWRVAASSVDLGLAAALPQAVPFLVLGLLACAVIWGFSWVQARATLYTITTHRVAMRVGAALTLTLNLPFTKIAGASLEMRRGGTGTIALQTLGETRLSYLVLWPHVRPWHMKKTEPALRAIPDAERVAAILAEAAEARVAQPQIARRAPAAATVAAE
ncbi:PH domain-containing protein [Rhodobacteraceae bacterium CCMM004]|nr:PH domain-containing protein [Rhodobacteraceae bacterium CCMM004]